MDFDVVVIGSGAGGGTTAYKLAQAGLKVLILEKGKAPSSPEILQDEQQMLINRIHHDDNLLINNRTERLFTGSLSGGGTSLYGAVMLRPSPDDFHPGKFYSKYLPQSIQDWAIDYDQLEPFYTEAEDLYHVAGDKEYSFKNIGRRKTVYQNSTPQLEPINLHLQEVLRSQDVDAGHLPFAINFDTCLRCPTCPAYGCPNDSRGSSYTTCIKPAVENHAAEIWNEVEVTRLLKNSDCKVERVEILDRKTGRISQIRADLFILSAGAVHSPALLLKSDIPDKSDQTGRNFMYHAGVLSMGLFAKSTGGSEKFIKQLGWTDDYFGTEEFPHKLGYVQMLPIPGPLSIIDQSPLPMPEWFAKFLYRHIVGFAATVEDIPQADNRVYLDSEGKIALSHKFHNYDIFRSKYFKKRLNKLLGSSNAIFTFGATADKDDLHTAHQVGTLRFGKDPKHSVLDPYCRVHSLDNLFVIDGSFMPTSLGVGPALTIIANALRVSKYIITEYK